MMGLLSKPFASSRIYFEDHEKVREARDQIISRLKKLLSFVEVHEEELCDARVALCPIVSRAGTDIEAALSRLTADKPTIMMVLHHTFDLHATIPNSSGYDRENVLMVDALFHEDDGLLKCLRNEEALNKAANHIKKLQPQPPVSNNETENGDMNGKPFDRHRLQTPDAQVWLPEMILKVFRKHWCLWTACTAVTLYAWVFQKTRKHVSRPRKFLNSIKQNLPVCISCMVIARYNEEFYRQVLHTLGKLTAFQKYLPPCYLQYWPLWAACMAITLYTTKPDLKRS